MSLVARSFEALGTPTLVLGSALDILTAGRAPRVKFLDYPLGFTAGRFQDKENQYEVVKAALSGFDTMITQSSEHLDFSWPEGWQMIHEREQGSVNSDTRSERDEVPRYQTPEDKILAEKNISS